jgi:hypothetical protein|tara:strand:- start:1294 stop:1536 length:243 start_codon:yes stop_codon:yes gene_type:complete
MKTIYEKTAIITNTRNEISIDAEVDNIRENAKGEPESLDAFIATNKIHMRWNGKVYVGNAGGMQFTSLGPKQRSVSVRGR